MAGNNKIKAVAGVNATLLFQGYCKVRGWVLHNGSSSSGPYMVCLNLYDLARVPITGVDVPFYKIFVPSPGTSATGVNFSIVSGIIIPFYNGLAYSIVKADNTNSSSDANKTAVALDDLNGVLDWSVRTD